MFELSVSFKVFPSGHWGENQISNAIMLNVSKQQTCADVKTNLIDEVLIWIKAFRLFQSESQSLMFIFKL